MKPSAPAELLAYYRAGKALICDLEERPFYCFFWPESKLDALNDGYRVPIYAPGYFGFGSDGGGEMIAFSPVGSVVCVPFIGMKATAAYQLAPSWAAFESILRAKGDAY